MSISKELSEKIYKLRPQLIKAIHDKKIRNYIEDYKRDNNGKEPSKDNLQMFNSILIAQKVASKEADEIIENLFFQIEKEVEEERKKARRKIAITNTVIFLMILNLAASFILHYLKLAGIDLLGEYNVFNVANLVDAVLIILILIVLYVFSFR